VDALHSALRLERVSELRSQGHTNPPREQGSQVGWVRCAAGTHQNRCILRNRWVAEDGQLILRTPRKGGGEPDRTDNVSTQSLIPPAIGSRHLFLPPAFGSFSSRK
jgi:hypothetical protein